MRVYHFTKAEHGLENIERRRVKLATINDLNDPFELGWLTSPFADVRNAIARTKAHMHSIVGLVCFSRNWSNPVQWSHYAEQHRGICLGFDVPDKFLLEVVYERRRHVLTEAVPQEIKAKLIRTKFSHWRYEQEMRIFEDINTVKQTQAGLFFKDFSDDLALSEVIIGPKSKITRSRLDIALGNMSAVVKVKNARLSFKRYAVVTQRDRKFWL